MTTQIRVSKIINGKTGISADTALRLARYFGTSPDFWMNFQKPYKLDLAIDKATGKVNRDVEQNTRRRTEPISRSGAWFTTALLTLTDAA